MFFNTCFFYASVCLVVGSFGWFLFTVRELVVIWVIIDKARSRGTSESLCLVARCGIA